MCKGAVTLEHALNLTKLPIERQPSFVNKPSYAVDEALKRDKVKDAAKALREQLKALGHDVAGTPPKPDDGKVWVEVGAGGGHRADKWEGKVPRTTQLIVVKTESYATVPTVYFYKQIPKPAIEDRGYDRPRSETATKQRVEQDRERAEAQWRIDHIHEAQARALLEFVKRVSKKDYMEMLYDVEMEATGRTHLPNYINAKAATVLCTIAHVKPTEDETPHQALTRALNDEASTPAQKLRILAGVDLLGRDYTGRPDAIQRKALERVGFDEDAVEVPPFVQAEEDIDMTTTNEPVIEPNPEVEPQPEPEVEPEEDGDDGSEDDA